MTIVVVMILSICDLPDTLKVMRIVNIVITIIKVVVPIMLIVSAMIDLVRAISDSELNKITKPMVNKVIAALLVFLIPTFVKLIAQITLNDGEYEACLGDITKETIKTSYINQGESLVKKAEESGNQNDYITAENYLSQIENETKRKELEDRLKVLKEKKEEERKEQEQQQIKESTHAYSNVNFSNFKWTYYSASKAPAKSYYKSITSYAVWAPKNLEDLNGVSLPLIYFMHGYGEIESKFAAKYFIKNDVLTRVLNNWNSYNLDPVPAIIIAPHAPYDFRKSRNVKTMDALIKYAKDTYNIDSSRIVLMGHSMGADDTIIVPYENKSSDVFCAYVLFACSSALDKAPYNNSEAVKKYFENKKIRAYEENKDGMGFFKFTGRTDEFLRYQNKSHSTMPKVGLIEDKNSDGVSDLMYWLFGEDAIINKKETNN